MSETPTEAVYYGTATYSPEDNKLRFYPFRRLERILYDRITEAGFIWAPKQELFVAPSWTPSREDLMLEWCGEIEDEDKSLIERAEDRADRFSDYSNRRQREADMAHNAVAAIADNIPLGQPIIVGHHSERRARKDAERIQTGMRKAINLWETSKYWTDRAASALRHAKYLERPDVRHRRIKTLDAEIRKYKWRFTPDPRTKPQVWDGEEHVYCAPKGGRGGHWTKTKDLPGIKAWAERWIAHLNNRIAYEKAMLGEQGGIAADQFDIQPGGMVLIGTEWVTVIRVNKSGGVVSSVTTNARYVRKRGIEEVKDYRPPTEEDATAVKKATTLAPLCNYRTDNCIEMTEAEWKKTYSEWKGTDTIAATETAGRHRLRYKIKNWRHIFVFITDAKEKRPPKPEVQAEQITRTAELPKEVDLDSALRGAAASERARQKSEEEANSPLAQMKDSLRAGVQVVVAPQLFATPNDIAAEMVEAAEIEPGQTVLEPSAGTGNIVKAIIDAVDTEIVGYEINGDLCNLLSKTFPSYKLVARRVDFLEVTEGQGKFPRIVMNPPFENGSDIKHILHALTFLAPDGRLVSLCADGPRQREQLKPLADDWTPLPEGSFKSVGTNINVDRLVIINP
jgi:protein-L-isoaspartate O-methyltransferase